MKHLPIRSYLVSALIMAASSTAALALDINSASTAELEAAGFTQVQAHNIKAYHAVHGDFKSSADLLKVKGITRKTLTSVENNLNSAANANTSIKTNVDGNVSAGSGSTAAGATGNITGNGGVSVGVGGGGVSVGGSAGAGANTGAGGGTTGGGIGAGAQGGVGISVK